jgi:hypothetical protein
MEKEKRQEEGKSERFLGLIALTLKKIAVVLKYFFFPHNLTVGDAKLLKKVHEETGIPFVIDTDRKFRPPNTSNKEEKNRKVGNKN